MSSSPNNNNNNNPVETPKKRSLIRDPETPGKSKAVRFDPEDLEAEFYTDTYGEDLIKRKQQMNNKLNDIIQNIKNNVDKYTVENIKDITNKAKEESDVLNKEIEQFTYYLQGKSDRDFMSRQLPGANINESGEPSGFDSPPMSRNPSTEYNSPSLSRTPSNNDINILGLPNDGSHSPYTKQIMDPENTHLKNIALPPAPYAPYERGTVRRVPSKAIKEKGGKKTKSKKSKSKKNKTKKKNRKSKSKK